MRCLPQIRRIMLAMLTQEQLAYQLNLQRAILARCGVEFVPRAAQRRLAVAAPEVAPVALQATGRVELQQLAAVVQKCRKCPSLFATRTQTVFGGGPINPPVLFIADAPSSADDATGLVLQGDVGALFDRMLARMNLSRDAVYITTAIKCHPANGRQPKLEECANCRVYLTEQLRWVQPKVICCLGSAASQSLLNTTANITELRSTVHQHENTPVVCTLSLAYLLKNEPSRKLAWEDLQRVLALIAAS